MQKWHVTVGLVGLALVAGTLAPRPSDTSARTEPTDRTDDPEAINTGPLVLQGGLAHEASPPGVSEQVLVLEVRAPQPPGGIPHRAVDLAIALDASSSMSANGRLMHVQTAAKALARTIGPDDTLSMVVFGDTARLIRPPMPVTAPSRFDKIIEQIVESGGTNLYAGLVESGRVLAGCESPNRVRKLVLLTDGKATVGITSPEKTLAYAAGLGAVGITVSTVGLGLDFSEDSLARIADMGGGHYTFADDLRRLTSILHAEHHRSAHTVARDARVQVELPPSTMLVDTLGALTAGSAPGQPELWLGDMRAGETRHVVLKLRTQGRRNTSAVATARLRYMHDGDIVEASLTVRTAVQTTTRTPETRSREWSTMAHQAYANRYIASSVQAYANGAVPESHRLLRAGQAALIEAAEQLDAPQLLANAEDLDVILQMFTAHVPSSSAGRRAIKLTKEMSRGRDR